jgi:Probable Zinc-ribbon domain
MKIVCDDNCLATLFPLIAAEWHPTKNNNITPKDVIAKSHKKFWFKCSNGHDYETDLSNRTRQKPSGCPYCCGRLACEDNCLATINPKVANEWHPTKNGNNTPHNVVAGSHKEFWFLCDKGHEWSALLYSRANNGNKCPYCANQLVCDDNCLATLFPSIAAEWHPTKNGNVTPKEVIAQSNKKFWFKCSKGHEWKTSPNTRVLCNSQYKGNGCPYCYGLYVCDDNCLATLFPSIAAEWHPTKNGCLTPRDVVANSHKKHWFKCPKGHEYPSQLNNRTISGNGCPRCKESKGERKIANVLKKLGIHCKRQVRFKGCRHKQPLPFDFVIFPKGKDPGIIEYHGSQHYIPSQQFGGAKAFASLQIRDDIKRQFCEDKKISMLEISYLNFNRIEEMVLKFIESLPPPRKGLAK